MDVTATPKQRRVRLVAVLLVSLAIFAHVSFLGSILNFKMMVSATITIPLRHRGIEECGYAISELLTVLLILHLLIAAVLICAMILSRRRRLLLIGCYLLTSVAFMGAEHRLVAKLRPLIHKCRVELMRDADGAMIRQASNFLGDNQFMAFCTSPDRWDHSFVLRLTPTPGRSTDDALRILKMVNTPGVEVYRQKGEDEPEMDRFENVRTELIRRGFVVRDTITSRGESRLAILSVVGAIDADAKWAADLARRMSTEDAVQAKYPASTQRSRG